MFPHFCCIASLLVASVAVSAQTAPPPPSAPPQGDYKLNITSRLVIEDLTVTDRQGKPVKGLPRAAFHLFDNKVPQQALHFEENTGEASQVTESTGGLQTNRQLVENKGTLVSLLIDPMSIDLPDQMFLRLQALHFLDTVPAGTELAVFRANNRGIPVLLQAPTADKALLRKAVDAAVPVIARPVDNIFANAVTELGNLSEYFRGIPGRKAVLWLAGQFPLYQAPTTAMGGGDTALQRDARKAAFRALEQARIAVYPIDVRGVQMGGPAPTVVTNEAAAANDPSTAAKPLLGESEKTSGQYEQMDSLAFATGGQAFYSNNAVATLMHTATTLAASSYALSYRPTDYVTDGSWHKVEITVDGPYTVHYRTGYYADDKNPSSPEKQRRALLMADGGTTDGTASQPGQAQQGEAPILFSARVLSTGKGKKADALTVRYVIPTTQLHFETASGQARFRVAALAYNGWGDVLSHAMDTVQTHFTPEQMALAKRIGTPADQTLTVASSAQFLLLAVEDLETERVGTLQLQLASVPSAPVATAAKP